MHTDAGDSMIIAVSICGRTHIQIGFAEEGLDISIHDVLMEEHMLPLVEEDKRLVDIWIVSLLRRR